MPLLLAVAWLFLAGCHGGSGAASDPPDAMTLREDRGLLAFDAIHEASGLAASRTHPHVLWTHNDSGDAARLFALTTWGVHLGVYTLAGAMNRDWEDLAVGPGPEPGRSYLYVGDIGDNEARHEQLRVYRIPEPPVAAGQTPVDTTLTGAATITLRYPDGPHDAETLLSDPLTGDLFIVTKRSPRAIVFRAPFPQSTIETILLERVTTLELDPVPNVGPGGQGAVAGDVSASGLDVLLKTYVGVYRWSRPTAQAPLFGAAPVPQPYVPEPQGEAIAWAADGGGYFTVSEETGGIPARLYFYRVVK